MESGLNILETEDGYTCLGSTLSNDGDVTGFHGVPGNLQYGDDIWVFKIDRQGNLIWQNCLGGLYYEFARNIFPTSDGGYMIVGTTDGDVVGFNGGDTGGYDDIWFAKIDSLGQLTWQYCYGGFGTEYLYRGVYQKGDYNYVLTLGTKTDDWQCNINTAKPDLRIVELYDTTVGIDEEKGRKTAVEFWPNPTKGIVNIQFPELLSSGSLKIYGQSGKEILNIPLYKTNSNLHLDCSQLKPGIYFYSLQSGAKLFNGEFIVSD